MAASNSGSTLLSLPATRAAVRGLGLATFLALACGCQGGIYQAGKLPLEYSASSVASTRKVDLSRLARTSSRSDAIYPGDVVEVTIATGLEDKTPESWSLRVSDRGDVNVPLVGCLPVAGLLLPDAEVAIRQESIARRVYRDPHVSVLLKHRKTIRVAVVGAVASPGSYDLPAVDGDLLSALMAAGGLSKSASTIVEIRRVPSVSPTPAAPPAPSDERRTVLEQGSVRIDLIAASEGIGPDYRIEDGSVIMVREQDPKTIQVLGLVHKPDQFEIPADKDVRLLDALALAGGRTMELADKVHVIRNLQDATEPIVIEASVREAKRSGPANLLLAPGDVVSVEETPLTFTVGTVQNFVRFGFSSAIPGF